MLHTLNMVCNLLLGGQCSILEAKLISQRQVWMAHDAKRREFAADLQSGEDIMHFFKIAKQMARSGRM